MGLVFNQKGYAITYQDKEIQLLRREYDLLSFLYQNEGHGFSRSELLDAVWENEFPVDRTVDDHIFRLRKKLNSVKEVINIKTIRGYGYSLEIKKPALRGPIAHNQKINNLSQQLLSTYQLYGYGQALKIFQQNNDDLGVLQSEETQQLSWLTNPSLLSIVQDRSIPFKQKSLLYIHLYLITSENPKKTLKYFNQIKNQGYFSKVNKNEAATLTPIFINIMCNQYEKATQLVEDAKVIPPTDGFYPSIQLFKLMLFIQLNDKTAIQTLSNQLEMYFKDFPFQREMALYQMLQGMIHIQNREAMKGKELVYLGLQAAKDTGFFLHYLNVFFIAVVLLKAIEGGFIYSQLQNEWGRLRKQYRLELIKKEIEKQFKEVL
ncbi:winged helix-turn-helix domain-containing protein [Oceanobacillus jeddahense]|uniref:winged helix-turn-helix domain-containing protein n=1 Tax=Oceanobacillus jeddahense TaxID=1462527 RepID=UPI000694875A|nr:winged helix-turn-helix domain-containing protein [Oceanobacillus jeddahense]